VPVEIFVRPRLGYTNVSAFVKGALQNFPKGFYYDATSTELFLMIGKDVTESKVRRMSGWHF